MVSDVVEVTESDSSNILLLFLEGNGVAVTNEPALDLLGLSSIFSKHSLGVPS